VVGCKISGLAYFAFWVVGLSTSNWFYGWVIIEVSNWILVLWVVGPHFMLSFLVWQSLCGIVFVYRYALFWISLGVLISLLMKTGMPPFHLWLGHLKWRWTSWIVFLTAHKTLPFLLIITLPLFDFLFIGWPIIAIVILYSHLSLYNLMFISSINDGAWICLNTEINYFWLYMLVYIMLWLGWGFYNQTNRITGLASRIYFLILIGLPPFVIFFLKVLLWSSLDLVRGFLLTLASWWIILIYLCWLILTLFRRSLLVKRITQWVMVFIFFVGSVIRY